MIGSKIRRLREEREITYRKFEQDSGIDPRNLVKYEKGERLPSIPTLRRIARALGVKVEDLL